MDYGYDAKVWRNQLDKHCGCLWLWGLLEYEQILSSPFEASTTIRVRFWRNDCMMIEKKSWQECIFAAHLNIDLTKFCDIFQPGRECANTQIADWNPIPPCHLFKILQKREYLGEEGSLLRRNTFMSWGRELIEYSKRQYKNKVWQIVIIGGRVCGLIGKPVEQNLGFRNLLYLDVCKSKEW